MFQFDFYFFSSITDGTSKKIRPHRTAREKYKSNNQKTQYHPQQDRKFRV
jgi:hypothetical protein